LVEGLIFRLNQVPERNYVEFLNLLGIVRDPATPATVWVVFQPNPARTLPVVVPALTRVATPQTETQSAITFETNFDLQVVPTNLVEAFLVDQPGVAPLSPADVTSRLVASRLLGLQIEVRPDRPQDLYLAFDSAPDQAQSTKLALHAQIAQADAFGTTVAPAPIDLACQFSKPLTNPNASPEFADIDPAQITDETGGLHSTGRLVIPTPAGWGALPRWKWINPAGPPSSDPALIRNRFWLRLRISVPATGR